VAAPRTDFARILEILRRHRVRFILVGGVAAVIEGVPVSTFDLDIVHDRASDNLTRLLGALKELQACYRSRRDVKLTPTAEALAGEGHHLLMTRFGPLDVLGMIGKHRDFAALVRHARRRKLHEIYITLLDLETQILVKEELGHEKDKRTLPLLREAIEMRDARPSPQSRPGSRRRRSR